LIPAVNPSDTSTYANNYNKAYSKKNSLNKTPTHSETVKRIINYNKNINPAVNFFPGKKDISSTKENLQNLHFKKYSLTRNITRKNSTEYFNIENMIKDIPLP